MASKRRNMFHKNKTQETTEIARKDRAVTERPDYISPSGGGPKLKDTLFERKPFTLRPNHRTRAPAARDTRQIIGPLFYINEKGGPEHSIRVTSLINPPAQHGTVHKPQLNLHNSHFHSGQKEKLIRPCANDWKSTEETPVIAIFSGANSRDMSYDPNSRISETGWVQEATDGRASRHLPSLDHSRNAYFIHHQLKNRIDRRFAMAHQIDIIVGHCAVEEFFTTQLRKDERVDYPWRMDAIFSVERMPEYVAAIFTRREVY
ncbi:hypothetical protein AAG570_012212 [Ranatra chinensis]|uniref:Uncharacterized protein n=1 Tax=Ranatra chinensis TaxID=642074 RepID=A0ABD0YIF0_9HEMI